MSALDFIEACYCRHDDLTGWARGLLAEASKLHGKPLGSGAYSYRLGPDNRIEILELFSAPGSDLAEDPEIGPTAFVGFINQSAARGDIVAATFGSCESLVLLSTLATALRAPLVEELPIGAADSLCMRGFDGDEGFHLCVLATTPIRLGRERRRYLEGLSEHVAAGFRVQRVLASLGPDEGAVLAAASPSVSASGESRLLHAKGRLREPDAAGSFLRKVDSMERARRRGLKQGPEEAARLWSAFVDGEYSLVESIDSDGKRMILAVRTKTRRAPALTAQEHRVVSGVVAGASNKAIGADLGISASTVAVHLQAATRKLGFRNRQSLVACFEPVGGGPGHETSERESGFEAPGRRGDDA